MNKVVMPYRGGGVTQQSNNILITQNKDDVKCTTYLVPVGIALSTLHVEFEGRKLAWIVDQ